MKLALSRPLLKNSQKQINPHASVQTKQISNLNKREQGTMWHFVEASRI